MPHREVATVRRGQGDAAGAVVGRHSAMLAKRAIDGGDHFGQALRRGVCGQHRHLDIDAVDEKRLGTGLGHGGLRAAGGN